MQIMEKYGISASNPEKTVLIPGGTYSDIIGWIALQGAALGDAAARLRALNEVGEDDELYELQCLVQALLQGNAAMLQDHLRWAREQGLDLVIGGKGAVLQ